MVYFKSIVDKNLIFAPINIRNKNIKWRNL